MDWLALPSGIWLPIIFGMSFGHVVHYENRTGKSAISKIHLFTPQAESLVPACGTTIAWDNACDDTGIIPKDLLCRHCAGTLWRRYHWRPKAGVQD